VNIINGLSDHMMQHYTGSNVDNEAIPQIDILLKYKVFATDKEPEKSESINEQVSFRSPTFQDGSFVKINGEQLFLAIEEENVEFSNKNFTFEVLVSDRNNENSLGDTLLPMKIENNPEDIEDMSYFLDFRTDDSIDDSLYCQLQTKKRKKTVFDNEKFQCAEDVGIADRSPYKETDAGDKGEIC